LALLGYPPKDLLERPSFIKENLRRLEKLASEIKGLHILVGYVDTNPLKVGKPLVNSVALIGEGRILARGGKRLLPTYDVFDETRYFEPASKSLLLELEGKRLGVTICEDIWNMGDIEGMPCYELDPVSELADQKIEVATFSGLVHEIGIQLYIPPRHRRHRGAFSERNRLFCGRA
jgi:predicted amidohydrolase